jgi:hypothetical protein
MIGSNNQFPSANNQIMTKIPMTKIQNGSAKCILGDWTFGHWNLFGIWNLDIGI